MSRTENVADHKTTEERPRALYHARDSQLRTTELRREKAASRPTIAISGAKAQVGLVGLGSLEPRAKGRSTKIMPLRLPSSEFSLQNTIYSEVLKICNAWA